MQRITFNSLRFLDYLDNFNPQNSGIFFSILLHLSILLFAVGIPNFFGPKDIFVPNIIPIEILNVSETTNFEKQKTNNDLNKKIITKQKNFNSSNNTEIQKNFEIKEKIKKPNEENITTEVIKQKSEILIEQKKILELDKKINIQPKTKIDSMKTNSIKPKIKPKPIKQEPINNKTDVQIDSKLENKKENKKKEIMTEPKLKPEKDFNIASMLKDLRNEKSNNVKQNDIVEEEAKQSGEEDKNENMILSISEIDLLRQQLSSCWIAPAGAIIERGMKVTISAKVRQNMKVFQNSVRIVDTNISKSNTFYGPITDSAMRTLLNPECTPLKLPEDKYNLWKNLTITFDYSIMKGY